MATFPLLSSGSLTQYPAPFLVSQNVGVIRFVDGAEQRFLLQGVGLRSWQIRLDLLSESEVAAVESFFEELSGTYSSFTFVDPVTGASVPNCRIAESSLVSTYVDVNNASAFLWVIETNG
ncbi:MAG: hypothetical protein JO061_23045 [Acidobacteriaceae bacterium]|nr:hypothetical protein [Acidobacteriaceae bacterium]